MIICYTENDRSINLRWREEGIRQEKTIANFRPYFFIKQTDKRPTTFTAKEFINGKSRNIQWPLVYEEGDWVNLEGRILTKVIVGKPADIVAARKLWKQTYEADIQFHHRYCIDELSEIPEYEMRKWYWDMEWLNGDALYGDAITAIAVYDNYTEKYTIYTWFPRGHKLELGDEIQKQIYCALSEKEMLETFVYHIQKQDPDMLIAWFGLKFDLPKLIERMAYNGLDPRNLSPYGGVKGVYHNGNEIVISNTEYSPIAQPIKGRITLNLDLAFERQWNDAQRGTLPSLALDYVAEIVLGQKKLVSEKFPDKNEFFKRGWLEDTERYLEYAMMDVELLRKLDESNFTSEAVLALQRLLIAPFDACFYASHMGSMYFMRNASWKAKTGQKKMKCPSCKKIVKTQKNCLLCKAPMFEAYEGAMIYDPMTEGTNGLHLNVAAFDFAGLYPSMILARNISWETKSNEPTEFACNIKTPRDFSPVTEEEFIYYKTDKLGLLPKSVRELKVLRDDYKKKMKAADTQEEYVKWYNNQMAVKRLMASFYGITAYRGFGWCDLDMAASITASAREAIRMASFKVRELE
jgi:DNA polymerase elongation subunit (family B)